MCFCERVSMCCQECLLESKANRKVKRKAKHKAKNGSNSGSIADMLNLYQYASYNSIPQAKMAWVTIHAQKRGLDPKMVKAGIRATFTKRDPNRNL